MHGSEPTPSLDTDALVVTLEHDERHTRTLVRRPLAGDLSAWEGVTANAVLVSTVRLPVAFVHPRQRWETMAFPVYFRGEQMDVDYDEVACRHAPDREGAERNHTDVVREFSEGPSDRDPVTGIQYGDIT